MAKRLLDKRLEHEAAERMKRDGKQAGGTTSKKKAAGTTARKKAGKTAAKRTPRKKKSTTSVRRQLMWAVFNGAMKEEARFAYHDREAAEERLASLREKSKKQLYFIQPIKVPLSEMPLESEAIEDEDLDLDEEEVEAELDDEDGDGPSEEE